MDSKKTSIKLPKSPRKSKSKAVKYGGMTFTEFTPGEKFRDGDFAARAITEAIMTGDKEAFQEILAGFISANNVIEIAKATNLGRQVIYDAMDKTKNPTIKTVFKIMSSVKSKPAA